MLLNFFFLIIVLYISLNGFSLTYLFKSLAKIATATMALAAILLLALPHFSVWLHGSVIQQAAGLLILILSAALVYGFFLHRFKLSEMHILTAMIRSKIFRR